MDRWKLPDGLSKVVVASSPVGATCTDSFGTWPGEPRGCLTPDACSAARQEFDGDYDHGWDHGYAAAISHVRTRLGLSPDSTHEQVLDAVRGVRQAHPVRYESVPPPGWIVTSDGRWARTKKSVSPARRTEAWEVYDREHGYAPPKQDAPPARDWDAELSALGGRWAQSRGGWFVELGVLRVPSASAAAGSSWLEMLRERNHAIAKLADERNAAERIARLKGNRAPTYAEVLEAAAAAKREIDSEWPAWKKGL